MIDIRVGDAREILRTLPSNSIHCCVTSPPYWNLRNYGDQERQLGQEESPLLYVRNMVALFEEVRRVLRPDGTLWLNLGDTWAGDNKTPGIKRKDLIGIPWRVALALQEAGWWLRMDNIWKKKNPMTESVTDRPSKEHEYIFLLTKSETAYYDHIAVRRPMAERSVQRLSQPKFWEQTGGDKDYRNTGENANRSVRKALENVAARSDGMRNLRSVWDVAVGKYKGAHFATYPEELIEPCILAGTSARGVCPACGAPWKREISKRREDDPQRKTGRAATGNKDRRDAETKRKLLVVETVGWNPSCACAAGDPVPATVLDPFAGSGTTLAVALKHGRSAIGIELNPEYIDLINTRIGTTQPKLVPI